MRLPERHARLPRAFRATLSASPEAPARARHALRSLCRSPEAEIVVSELVTNAVRHTNAGAGAPILLEASVAGGAIRLEVTDRGPGFAHRGEEPARGSIGGWGLAMVRELSSSWTVERVDGGRTRVRAEVPLGFAAQAA